MVKMFTWTSLSVLHASTARSLELARLGQSQSLSFGITKLVERGRVQEVPGVLDGLTALGYLSREVEDRDRQQREEQSATDR